MLLPEVRDGSGTLLLVRDGLGEPPIGTGLVVGPFRRSQTGRQALQKLRDGSGTLPKSQDRLEESHGGPGQVGRPYKSPGTG